MMIMQTKLNLAIDQMWKHFYVYVSNHGHFRIRLSAESCKSLRGHFLSHCLLLVDLEEMFFLSQAVDFNLSSKSCDVVRMN